MLTVLNLMSTVFPFVVNYFTVGGGAHLVIYGLGVVAGVRSHDSQRSINVCVHFESHLIVFIFLLGFLQICPLKFTN